MKPKKLIEPNELSAATKASMRTRIITALIMAACVIPCIVLGGWFFFVLSALVAIAASYELVHVLRLQTKFKYFIFAGTILLLLSIIYWIFIKNNLRLYHETGSVDMNTILFNGFKSLSVSPSLILVAAGVMFGISFISEEFSPSKVFYLISMIVIVGLCLQALLYLRFAPTAIYSDANCPIKVDTNSAVFKYAQSMFLFLYVILGTIMCDIGAYFTGVLFGKHKVNPRISPNKTWEGFYGGIAISFIVSAAFALIVAAVGLPIIPNLDLNHWYWIVIISLVMPIFANLGDFAFSAIKRGYGIKDFSNLLPGHGGILDRIDSILFVSGFAAVMVMFINNGWDFLI